MICINQAYNGKLIPLMRDFGSDDYICEYENKYLLIHTYASVGWQETGRFNTPQEVWEMVIKPSVENYI